MKNFECIGFDSNLREMRQMPGCGAILLTRWRDAKIGFVYFLDARQMLIMLMVKEHIDKTIVIHFASNCSVLLQK
jgi:hypothetical protein